MVKTYRFSRITCKSCKMSYPPDLLEEIKADLLVYLKKQVEESKGAEYKYYRFDPEIDDPFFYVYASNVQTAFLTDLFVNIMNKNDEVLIIYLDGFLDDRDDSGKSPRFSLDDFINSFKCYDFKTFKSKKRIKQDFDEHLHDLKFYNFRTLNSNDYYLHVWKPKDVCKIYKKYLDF